MTIAPAIFSHRPPVDPEQLAVIAHEAGPMLVIAGPGSGKTAALCLRSANLLLTRRVEPEHLLLCTFTRAAAREMRQRLTAIARAGGYAGDLSRVRTTTIHGLCHWLLSACAEGARASQSSRIVNAREQLDLMSLHFHRIFGPDLDVLKGHGWHMPVDIVAQARRFFDRIADETIADRDLIQSGSSFLEALAQCRQRYRQLLEGLDAIDFGGLQEQALRLLADARMADCPGNDIHHVLVDEYQDTNFAQQQLLFRLADAHRNICVVGDEDQLLYRFRGANPDGFNAFERRFPDVATYSLSSNYRSHRHIVDLCNRWIRSFDRSKPDGSGPRCRQPRSAEARGPGADDRYPAVVSILGDDGRDEATQLAKLLRLIKDQGFIGDFHDVAILLPSVKERYTRHVLKALGRAGISVHLAGDEDRVTGSGHLGAAGLQPTGHVLLTTIHQAKGREWPVVCVGGLQAADLRADELEIELRPYLTRTVNEPAHRAARLDLAHQYYVAFSRAQRLLIIAAQREPHAVFRPLWDTVPAWASVDLRLLSGLGERRPGARQLRDPSDVPGRLVVPPSTTLVLRSSLEGELSLVFLTNK